MMATGKTSRYRHNVSLETILSQAPKVYITMEKVQRLNGSGHCIIKIYNA